MYDTRENYGTFNEYDATSLWCGNVDENCISLVCVYLWLCVLTLEYPQVLAILASIYARGFIFSQTQMIGVIAPRVASSDQYLQNYLRDRIDR